ncbi:hypothetical protein DFP72DRAFT_902499 [Ephemerocybe angulata]|uniref:Uncharacterized protein n=1 Tax=Ephemerocybe angulata TaxID=980116 RepID=A0A8H6M4Y8_9AGAR|nr:hypothetical protein DFP72DRAFT_902481 [Tulosesus angulatus]KAF6753274.1 hypothetical protein DFP72DRAFT_902499 [Tulosesus angulatus]
MKVVVYGRTTASSSTLWIQRIPPTHVLSEHDVSMPLIPTTTTTTYTYFAHGPSIDDGRRTTQRAEAWIYRDEVASGGKGEGRSLTKGLRTAVQKRTTTTYAGVNELVVVDESAPTSSSMLRVQRSVSNALVTRTKTNSPRDDGSYARATSAKLSTSTTTAHIPRAQAPHRRRPRRLGCSLTNELRMVMSTWPCSRYQYRGRPA